MLKTLGTQVKEFKKPSMIAAFCTVAEVVLEISQTELKRYLIE